MTRPVLHAHQGGWETALDQPRAVVVDYPSRSIRFGLSQIKSNSEIQFRFLSFLLRAPGLCQHPRAISVAIYGHTDLPRSQLDNIARAARDTIEGTDLALARDRDGSLCIIIRELDAPCEASALLLDRLTLARGPLKGFRLPHARLRPLVAARHKSGVGRSGGPRTSSTKCLPKIETWLGRATSSFSPPKTPN